MKAFLGTTLGKVVIGVLAAAVVAGGGYGIYQAVQSDPAPIPETTIDETTTEAIITTQAETTTEEEITEAPTEAPTAAPTAAPTTTTTTTKAPTTTQKAIGNEAPVTIDIRGIKAPRQGEPGAYYYIGSFAFPLQPGGFSVPTGTRWVSDDDGTTLSAGQDMAGQQNGKFYWIG